MNRINRLSCGVVLGACALMLPACRTQYAADIRNNTSQPLYANILERTGEGTILRASSRLGPGDRAAVGPAMIKPNLALLQLDTKSNSGAPFTLDLPPGVSIFEVTIPEGGSGQIQVREITP